MPQPTHSICENCKYYFHFSYADKKLLENACFQNGITVFEVKGVCIRGQASPGVFIDRLLFDTYLLKHCRNMVIGESIFFTPYRCSKCYNHLYVKNDGYFRHFYCLECNNSFKSLLIGTNCRFCETPLTLEAGKVFRCKCNNCGKGINIPLLPQVYPSIIPYDELCVHGKKVEECDVCFTCTRNRSNILLYEISRATGMQRDNSEGKKNRSESEKSHQLLSKSEKDHQLHGIHFNWNGVYLVFDEDDRRLISRYYSPDKRILDWSDCRDDIEDWEVHPYDDDCV